MKIDWIEQGALAASALPTGARAVRELHEDGIRAIVTLTEQPLTLRQDINAELFTELEITYLHVPIEDFQAPDEQQVQRVVSFIDRMRELNKPTLVHCYAGVGRTGTILHSYYLFKGLSLDEAKQKVLTTRPIACFDELSTTQQLFLEALVLKLNGHD